MQYYGVYPGAMVHEVTGGGVAVAAVWPSRLRPLLAGNRQVFHCPSRDENALWSDRGPLPLRLAQLGSRFVAFGYEPGEPLINEQTYFSYGYNAMGAGDSEGSVADGTHMGLGCFIGSPPLRDNCELRNSRVKLPSEMIAIADTTVDGKYDYVIRPHTSSGAHLWPGRVHGGGANVLFCDGHVAWYRQDELLVDNRHDPREAEKVRRWNNDHSFSPN